MDANERVEPVTEQEALQELKDATKATKDALDRLNTACQQLLAVRAIRCSQQKE